MKELIYESQKSGGKMKWLKTIFYFTFANIYVIINAEGTTSVDLMGKPSTVADISDKRKKRTKGCTIKRC